MKKFTFSVMAAAAFLIMIVAPSTTLAFTAGGSSCTSMKVMHVGINPALQSGVEVFLKNQTGAACGTLGAGVTGSFAISSKNTDKLLATLLTAASLKKNVWVFAAGASQPYALGYIQVLKISE